MVALVVTAVFGGGSCRQADGGVSDPGRDALGEPVTHACSCCDPAHLEGALVRARSCNWDCFLHVREPDGQARIWAPVQSCGALGLTGCSGKHEGALGITAHLGQQE